MKYSLHLCYALGLSTLLSCTTAKTPTTPTASSSPAAAPSAVSDTDRDKFLGEWSGGKYSCNIGSTIDNDKLKIEAGADAKSVKLTLFMTTGTPSNVTGTLSDSQTITLPEQQLNGVGTHGKITFAKDHLELELNAGGLADCKGTPYKK